MADLTDILKRIRNRLIEFRTNNSYEEISMHINAIEIAVCLVEYSLKTNPVRAISKEEEQWYQAGYQLDLILGNSEWEDLVDLYYEIVKIVKKKNFFR